MLQKEKQGVRYLEFELFADFPHVRHAIFLRDGGFSEGCYSSLNLSYFVGDEETHVKQNEEKILSILGASKLARGNLCHGKSVVDAASLRSNSFRSKLSSDGIATKELNLCLLSTHADCQAALFYDPVHHAAANVHAGWRGNVQNIYQETVHFMKKAYATKSQDLHVCISPSLSPDHAEFLNYKKELPAAFWQFEAAPDHFDFWEISRMQLLEAGLLPHHIQIAKIDTFSNEKDYFSYRRNNITGRNASVIQLC
ncbi:MAG TPA: peptidoglycan editing factor PgeF [Parachlamydiaceae bacterium]|nr:peptidoglycan editing factor PgeF [Parachlamydiaceae bacterium]